VPHAFAWPAAAFVLGTACGIAFPIPPIVALLVTVAALGGGAFAYRAGNAAAVLSCVLAGWVAAGAALGSRAERTAEAPPLRRSVFAETRHATDWARPRDARPAMARVEHPERVLMLVGRLREDAARLPQGVGLVLNVAEASHFSWRSRAPGGAMLTVLGGLAASELDNWYGGRLIRLHAVVREPARYFDPGVPDFRLSLARRGIALVGSVKSASLVTTLDSGRWIDREAAAVRRRVRRWVHISVGGWDETTAAIATAILIGDRAGLDDRVERDLQDAGTYHVIAISGGNIAILTGCLLVGCRLLFVPWRGGLVLTILLLGLYAKIAHGGNSVERATTMAVVYVGSKLIDQRASAASALGVASALIVAATPLALVDPAFVLTFGATIGILVGVPRLMRVVRAPAAARGGVAVVAASASAELALLPLGPLFFSRLTIAGLVFNLAAVPLMAVVQISGLAAVAVAAIMPAWVRWAGWIPHAAARALVDSAALVHHVQWLSWRVPAPSAWLIALYYAALVAALTTHVWVRWTIPFHRTARRLVVASTASAAVLVAAGPVPARPVPARLRLVALDVGQGDASLVRLPSGRALLVDAGGLGGATRFDVGERVVAPALWALGMRRVDVLVLTHGDADHVGGAGSVLEMFRPREIWEGIPIPRDVALSALAAQADALGTPWRMVQAGDLLRDGEVRVRAWHPPPADWERQRVRNDDSVVLEIRYRDVSIVLPGDIGAAVEDRLASVIPPSRLRVLKVPHHGSASSSSRRWLDALKPQIAIVSCGRGNRFGHPSPAVLARYRAIGTEIYRTDEQGAITVDTDGHTIRVTPFITPKRPAPPSPTLVQAIERWLRATQ
jgi:competence protein ComEC